MPFPTAASHLWIPSVDGLTRDADHRYRLGSHQFPVSVTGVLQVTKSAYAMARIEETRETWEPRGNACHKALELAATSTDWHPDHWPGCWPWIDWCWPLLTHAIWDEARLCASEMGLYSLTLDIAGTFDGAFLMPRPGGGWRRILFDLKTQGGSGSSCYDTRPQLGGYLTLAAEHGIQFDGAVTLWARPGRCRLSRVFTVDECISEWRGALAAYDKAKANQVRALAAGVAVSGSIDPFAL
jgi:hypothetical protein